MDMEPAGGIPWYMYPLMLHSSREVDCSENTPEQCAYKLRHWVNWYQADLVYALGTVYFFIAVIATCFVSFWILRLAPNRLRRGRLWQKGVSGVRYLSYRHYETPLFRWYTPSIGVVALIVVGAVFFFAMTLGPHPYYWPNNNEVTYGSSPPIATRAGWMALACLPFLVILPTKANMIAYLTGVSHERLIVFHNWVGWAMFVLALVHTFPFIVYDMKIGTMHMEWQTDVFYWTGVIALIFQGYLQFMSLPWIRNRFYEFFKITHYAAAVVFVVIFFLHCYLTLSSVDYFIAAGVLYTLHFLYAQVRTYFEHGISHRASFAMVSDQALKITIPTDMDWQPGQHFFLRFLTLGAHALTAHPFTICSIPNQEPGSGKGKLVFYVQPRGGLTRRLAAAATKQPGHSVPVFLDGPYGGIRGRPLQTYDRTVIIACGAGAPFALGMIMNRLLSLARWAKVSEERPKHRMQVVLSSRDPHIAEWYNEALTDFMQENSLSNNIDGIEIMLHQTGQTEKDGSEKEIITSDTCLPIQMTMGRCNVGSVIEEASVETGTSVAVVACGPATMLKEANDAAAAAQKRILASGTGASELYLHTELFS
ncbi:ferric reductase [Xylariaceae sp. FL0016]|nr:ferric reductase [Xylariaceae sp. FL0016]